MIDLCGVMLACLGDRHFMSLSRTACWGRASSAQPIGFCPAAASARMWSCSTSPRRLLRSLSLARCSPGTWAEPSKPMKPRICPSPVGRDCAGHNCYGGARVGDRSRPFARPVDFRRHFNQLCRRPWWLAWKVQPCGHVMGVLAIAQHTRDIISGRPGAVELGHRRAQRLCLALTAAAMIPIAAVIVTLCREAGLGWGVTSLIAGMIVASGMLRQLTSIEFGCPRS